MKIICIFVKNILYNMKPKTYENLEKELNELITKRNNMFDENAKNGVPWEEYIEKSKDVYEKIFLIEREMRLLKTPTLDFNKEWKGTTYTIEAFKEMCDNEEINDEDGFGYYAIINAKSDVLAMPSDFVDNQYRKDFTHIIWFNK
jgi:hypothetical protein